MKYLKKLIILSLLFASNANAKIKQFITGIIQLGVSTATGYVAYETYKNANGKNNHKITSDIVKKLHNYYQTLESLPSVFKDKINEQRISFGLSATSGLTSILLCSRGINNISKSLDSSKNDNNEKNVTPKKDDPVTDALRVAVGFCSLFLSYKCGQKAYPHLSDLIKNYEDKKNAEEGKPTSFLNIFKDENEVRKKIKEDILQGLGYGSGSLILGILGFKLVTKGTHLFD